MADQKLDEDVVFYKKWILPGGWKLKDAVNLYLACDPDWKRQLIKPDNTNRKLPGYALVSYEAIDYINEEGKGLADIQGTLNKSKKARFLKDTGIAILDFLERTSLESFVQKNIDDGTLTARKDKNGTVRFRPIDIVKFFIEKFTATPAPDALLIALGLKKKTKYAVHGCIEKATRPDTTTLNAAINETITAAENTLNCKSFMTGINARLSPHGKRITVRDAEHLWSSDDIKSKTATIRRGRGQRGQSFVKKAHA